MLRGGHGEARHGVLGAVVLLNDSDAGDRVRALEVDQVGRGPDARSLPIGGKVRVCYGRKGAAISWQSHWMYGHTSCEETPL